MLTAVTSPAKRGRPKSEDRKLVEAVLASAAAALRPEQVAALCGIELREARKHLAKLCNENLAHNVAPGHRGAARYLKGRAPLGDAPQQRPVSRHANGHYDGRELQPFTGRPGAMDAFSLPSLQAGERVPRRAPRLIASNPEVRR